MAKNDENWGLPRQNPNCSAAKAIVLLDGKTAYECSEPRCPCYQDLCDVDECSPNTSRPRRKECVFKDYNGICKNDDTYTYGNYCPGHCDSYESK